MEKTIESEPKVSIIIPTYNAANFIEQAIQSIVEQTYSNIELIIVDGASTDSTLAILNQYKEHIAILISEPDQGIYDAMNKGVGLATGEWIYFLGADDKLYHEQVIAEIFSRSDIGLYDVVYGNVILKNADISYDGAFNPHKLYTKNICHQAIFVRKDVFKKIGYFNINYKIWADHDFNARWFNRKDIRHTYLPTTVAVYNELGFSSTQEDSAFLVQKAELFRSLGYPPKVSVIIPNYNHARYLPKRIESVLNQTFSFFEVILMDDCSTDNSREVIEQYAAQDDRIRVIYNEKNSGSTFKQWNKGVKEAKGEYIWLAESDDYADPTFLEQLVKQLDFYTRVAIGYCHSVFVNECDEIIGEWEFGVDKSLNKKWKKNFIEDGKKVVQHYMSFINVIPNASATLIRRESYLAAGQADESCRLTGDWLLWINILLHSDLFYVAQPLNHFRMHTQNVRSSTEKNGIYLIETAKVIAYILASVRIRFSQKNKIMAHFLKVWRHHIMANKVSLDSIIQTYKYIRPVDKFLEVRILKRLLLARDYRLMLVLIKHFRGKTT